MVGKIGWKDVLLLERKQLTCGTTWHAAGLIAQLRATKNMTRLAKYSQELYQKLEKETEDYLLKKDDSCPRCGESPDDCKCEEDDAWSTQNYHRVPKGTEHKAKPKQEFKK